MVDQVAVGSTISFDRQPTESVRLAIDVNGCTIGAGATVYVNGSPAGEAVSISDNGEVRSLSAFSSVSSLTISGLDGGFISAVGVDKLGQPVNQDIVVSNSMNVRFFVQKGVIRTKAVGQVEDAQFKMMAEPDSGLKGNDYVEALSGAVGLTVGRIDWIEGIFDFNGLTTHVEAYLNEI